MRSNRSRGKNFNILFPGGSKSPFGAADTTVTVAARRCLSGGSGVDWPPQVDRATVTVSVSGSPVIGELEIDVLRDDAVVLEVPDGLGRKPCVVQSFHFPAGPVAFPGGGEPFPVADKSSDCGPAEVSAGPTLGPWEGSEDRAVAEALRRVRNACKAQCHGDCSSGKCTYFERRSAVPLIEERTQAAPEVRGPARRARPAPHPDPRPGHRSHRRIGRPHRPPLRRRLRPHHRDRRRADRVGRTPRKPLSWTAFVPPLSRPDGARREHRAVRSPQPGRQPRSRSRPPAT